MFVLYGKSSGQTINRSPVRKVRMIIWIIAMVAMIVMIWYWMMDVRAAEGDKPIERLYMSRKGLLCTRIAEGYSFQGQSIVRILGSMGAGRPRHCKIWQNNFLRIPYPFCDGYQGRSQRYCRTVRRASENR
ncbi:MAG: hypothetical protein R2787_01910 [Saprospiraceae bacterium]